MVVMKKILYSTLEQLKATDPRLLKEVGILWITIDSASQQLSQRAS